MSDFRAELGKDPALIDVGKPLIYTISPLRSIAEVVGTTFIEKFGATTYSSSVDHYTYTGILWLVPCNGIMQLEVLGSFYQPTLSADSGTNFWSEEEPHILCMAAARAVEQTLRNFQGVKDWETSIQAELLGMEYDLSDTESSGFQQMEG